MEDFVSHYDVSGSALSAERSRMRAITSNIANANVTRTKDGGPYQKKFVVLKEKQVSNSKLEIGVEVDKIITDTSQPRLVYEPEHPDANPMGYVAYPNVNVLKEVTDMKTAAMAYQANLSVIAATKQIISKSLDIAK